MQKWISYADKDFRKPIIKTGARILRPFEYERLYYGCPKYEFRIILEAMLFTGMRYVEMQRFQKHQDWYDGKFISLPNFADRKVKRTQKERWIRLNLQGRRAVEHFLHLDYDLPTYQGWSQNMKCWARRGGLKSDGMSVKTTRKTIESWLMFTFPDRMVDVMLAMGHNMATSINHYLGLPFTERDRLEMLSYVVGWI